MNNWEQTMILIPTLNPNPDIFKQYIGKLTEAGFKNILVVNDGSRSEFRPLFDEIERMPECSLFHHAVNLGKGRALKNGINYYLNLPDEKQGNGIVSVDSDGQHRIKDVIKMAKELSKCHDALLLGVRNFNRNNDVNIPWKSRFGNKITTFFFKLLFGKKITDTQTGLRAFSNSVLQQFIDLPGERFEYETAVLIRATQNKIPIIEIPIDTVYHNNNEETHFHPLKDSYKIYALMFGLFFKYVMSSLSSFVIDILLFQVFIIFLRNLGPDLRISAATIGARIFSSLYNFAINKNIVFKNRESAINPAVRYFTLCIIQTLCSAGLVYIIFEYLGIPEMLIKIVVDTFLFFISFKIQQNWVFKNKENGGGTNE